MEIKMATMLVITDDVGDSKDLIARAEELASYSQDDLHIVHFVYEKFRGSSEDTQSLIDAIIEKQTEQLETQVSGLLTNNEINYKVSVVWGSNIASWVTDYAKSTELSMVLKTGHRSEQAFYAPTDWQLIRQCKDPVYIASLTKWRKSNNVLVALDLQTKNPEKMALNEVLLKQSKELAEQSGAKLYACYAPPVSKLLQDFGMQYRDEVEEQAIQETKEIINSFSNKFDIPLENFTVKAGKPDKVIPSIAANVKAGVVVIGTIGRSGLSGQVIGNTAENIMSLLKTDVLAMKPC